MYQPTLVGALSFIDAFLSKPPAERSSGEVPALREPGEALEPKTQRQTTPPGNDYAPHESRVMHKVHKGWKRPGNDVPSPLPFVVGPDVPTVIMRPDQDPRKKRP